MAAVNPILTSDRGKAHSVALAVLCVLAAVQMAATVRAIWLVKHGQAESPTGTIVPAAAGSPPAPPLPSGVSDPPFRMTPPPVPPPDAGSVSAAPSFAAPAPLMPAAAAPPPVVASAPAGHPSASPMDAELAELIEVAQQLRPLGDLKGALDVLRRAEAKAPDHPAVLEEFAQTYELMGLGDKAAAAREKLAALRRGPSTSSLSFQQTGGPMSSPAVLDGALSPATGLTTPDSSLPSPSKFLGIGSCEILRDRMTSRGEKVTLRVPIRSQPGVSIDPAAIDIDVFFFDLVNGSRVEQTKADAPVNTWVDAPVDWKDGQERLDVLYSMPEMTPEVVHNIGHRKFHGYIVKLYYQHKLQDTAMEPASLRDYGAASAPQTTGNPLLPPVTR